METPHDLIGTPEAVRILRCHPSTLHRWRAEGRVRAWKRGDRYLYSELEVRALLEPVAPAVPPPGKAELRRGHEAALAELRAAGLKV